MTDITISKEKIKKEKGIVILSIEEYQRLLKRAVPIYYLKGKEAKELDKLVKKGLKDHAQGKTRKIKSLKELE
ncbi:MAG: hypothetical protein KatS3mg027_2694 [Bacteroidia bacterium]|nr:MAG: hypothetical protein KatS3mg027_2694 [Bacteroidia bacterium]